MSESNVAQVINENRGGWNEAMGLMFVVATKDEIVAELTIGPQHLQPYGIVHGGVYAGIIETACSTGAALFALANGSAVVGLENATSFLHATRTGKLRVTAKPLTRGRRTQVWEATVHNDDGKAAAAGRVRLLCLEPGSTLAGTRVD